MSREQLDTLLNALLDSAQTLLETYGEFYPFAGVLNDADEVMHLDTPDNEFQTEMEKQVAVLITALKEYAEQDSIVVCGLVMNVDIDDADAGQPSEALFVGLEHRTGDSINVFLPYTREDDAIAYGDVFTDERNPEVF